MLTIQELSYTHPNKDLLFDNINLTVNDHDKIAIIGNNGVGKSTLLRIISQELRTFKGVLNTNSEPFYVPQIYGQYNHLTIAQALKIEGKLNAFKEILAGNTLEENFHILNDDWTIEDRCKEALSYWQLNDIDLSQKLGTLSGGQKNKIFLAGITIHQPQLILLDEPSNHLDTNGRHLLYTFVKSTKSAIIVVSHDRKLLNLLDTICELNKHGVKVYGGNFDFYTEQKEIENNALSQNIQNKERALRKAKEKKREIIERQQKLDSRGKGKQEKSGAPKIMMNTLRNNAENSTSRMKGVHSEKIGGISGELQELRSSLPDINQIKFGFDNSSLHKGKILINAENINFSYNTNPLWNEDQNFQIVSGERIVLTGQNGSGKTTLVKLIIGDLNTKVGAFYKADIQSVYIDQEYSLLQNNLNVYEQAQKFNTSSLLEHDIKVRLNRFLFGKDDWTKPCVSLSGGERMRLMLCCLIINDKSPDIIILDEPTNNLDIQNIQILTAAINEFQGTLIVISHDETFLEEININRTISLSQ